jgi:hypothetical protein
MSQKIYKLIGGSAPMSFMLASRNTVARRLYHFDGKVNRELRYARNQKSPFVDEQDGNFILEPIIFEDGFLKVEDSNPVLQRFLEVHPDNGNLFAQVDNKRDAQKELDYLELEADALAKARTLDYSMMENVARIALSIDPSRISTSELKRDIIVYARNNPEEFLSIVNDPNIAHDGLVARLFGYGAIVVKRNAIHYNLSNNKSKMLIIPAGQEAHEAVSSYFMTEEGKETMAMLEKYISE